VNEKTKLVIFSHITYCSGVRFDAKQITAKIKDKNPDTLVLIDGAHAFGQLDIDVHDIGCDFYVLDGHKWSLGSEQTGALYVRESLLADDSRVCFDPTKSFCVSPRFHPKIDNRNVELGTTDVSSKIGFATAVKLAKEIGINKIRERIAGLTRQLYFIFSTYLDSIQLISPQEIEYASGIVCFQLPNNANFKGTYEEYEEVVDKLESEYGIVCRAIPRPPSMRVCLHYFNTREEIDILAHALDEIISELGGVKSKWNKKAHVNLVTKQLRYSNPDTEKSKE